MAKQRMLSSVICTNDLTKLSNELSLLQMLTKNCNGVRKIIHYDQETTGYEHALLRSYSNKPNEIEIMRQA